MKSYMEADLHGFPAKDTTLRMHEWLGLRHDLPMPLVKNLLLINGLRMGGEMLVTLGIAGRAQGGNAHEAKAQTPNLLFLLRNI